MKSPWILIVAIFVGLLLRPVFEVDRPAPQPIAFPPSAQLATPQAVQGNRAWRSLPPSTSKPKSARQASSPTTSEAHPSPAKAAIITRPLPPLHDLYADEFPTDAELAISAALTQNRALTELERLDRLLALDEWQADEIFPILARRSAAYNPALRIRISRSETSAPRQLPSARDRAPRGTPTRTDPSEPTLDEELEEILTPTQNGRVNAEQVDAALWWDEIISDLANSQ